MDILSGGELTVQKNLVSLPRMMTAPGASGPSSLRTSFKARMISWQNCDVRRFSGGFCRVRMKTSPRRSSPRFWYMIFGARKNNWCWSSGAEDDLDPNAQLITWVFDDQKVELLPGVRYGTCHPSVCSAKAKKPPPSETPYQFAEAPWHADTSNMSESRPSWQKNGSMTDESVRSG